MERVGGDGGDVLRHPQPYVAVLLAVVVAGGVRLVTPERSAAARGLAALTAVGVVTAALAGSAPGWSAAGVLGFAGAGVALVALVLPWPRRGAMVARPSLPAELRRLWGRRQLARLWVTYNVRSRYAQAFLGVLWIALVPLATALVMSIVFARLLRGDVGGVPFIAFLLAGVVPWNVFRQSVTTGMTSMIKSMSLINQVAFPREIIVIAAFGEVLVDGAVMIGTMLVVNAIVGVWPNPHYVALPILIAIQLAFTLGLMLLTAWLSALIRDIPHLVNVLLQVVFYLCAVIYPASIIPDPYRLLVDLNPVAILIANYRDIIVYDRSPDWGALVYPGTLAVGLLVFGYRTFKGHEDTLADLA